MSENPTPAPRPRRRRRLVYVIVIALAVVVTQFDRDKPPLPREEGALTCVSPIGETGPFDRLEWTFELPEGGSFELRLYDDVYSSMGSIPDLTEAGYALDPAILEQLPERFTWEVFARDASGADLGNCRADVVQLR